jgi:hypothetical protein
VNRPFELEWMGGAPERLFRRRRVADDLPWAVLDPRDFPPELVARARASWTEGAWSEYCSAAAFAQVQRALLAAGAPVDLIGAAGEFVADEMLHVELNARVAMALGGAEPVLVDLEADPLPVAGATALERASEAVVRACCVGEALSLPLIAGARRASARHPLVGAVLERILADEGPHAALGWWYLEWAADRIDERERTRLATVALDELGVVASRWSELARPGSDGFTTEEGWLLSDVNALGWMESGDYLETAKRAIRERVVEPLARAGIAITPQDVEALLRAA